MPNLSKPRFLKPGNALLETTHVWINGLVLSSAQGNTSMSLFNSSGAPSMTKTNRIVVCAKKGESAGLDGFGSIYYQTGLYVSLSGTGARAVIFTSSKMIHGTIP